MDFRQVFSGIPDGIGLSEDPAYLINLYQQFEQVCFYRTTPNQIRPLRMWFPLDQHFDEFCESNFNSRRQSSLNLFEAYRFAEAGTATVQIMTEDKWPLVKRLYAKLPNHLQAQLFSLPVEKLSPGQLQHFRMAFRLCWLQVNCDESVLLQFNFETKEAEKITHSNSAEDLQLLDQRIDLIYEARKLTTEVRSFFRSEYSSDNRLKCLNTVQEILESRRTRLTALFKAFES